MNTGERTRVVLTGGPGAGKTTVLDVLRERGYRVGADAARSIIRERIAEELSPRPEPRSFAKQILEREIEAYDSIPGSPAFFERGVAEAVAMLLESRGLDDSAVEQLMADYRYDCVFLFPAWKAIYRQDSERDHTFEHAIRVCEGIRRWYARFAYDVVEVPFGSPGARADFILARVASR